MGGRWSCRCFKSIVKPISPVLQVGRILYPNAIFGRAGRRGAVGKSWVTLGKCFKHKTYVIRSTVSAEDCVMWDNPTKWTTSSNVSLSKMAAFN